jgi:hypothetical protein
MEWLVASRPQRYAGKWLMPGEVFKAKRQDAKVLKAIKRAIPAPNLTEEPDAPALDVSEYLDALPKPSVVDDTSDVEPVESSESDRTYQRRDMVPED